MLIDFNRPLLGVDDKKVDQAGNLAIILSNALTNWVKDGDAIKMWGWAKTLGNLKPLNLDTSDKNELREFIKKAGQPKISEAQLLMVISEAEEEETKKQRKALEKENKKK